MCSFFIVDELLDCIMWWKNRKYTHFLNALWARSLNFWAPLKSSYNLIYLNKFILNFVCLKHCSINRGGFFLMIWPHLSVFRVFGFFFLPCFGNSPEVIKVPHIIEILGILVKHKTGSSSIYSFWSAKVWFRWRVHSIWVYFALIVSYCNTQTQRRLETNII